MTNKMAVGLSPELALAIEAGVKDAVKGLTGKGDDLRSKVASDQKLKGITVEMTLEIEEVSIGHDTDKTPTVSIPLLPVLGLLVKRMGCTRDAAMIMLRDVMTQALTLDDDKTATEALLAEVGVADAMNQIKSEVISKLPRTPVAKPVKAKGAKITVTGVSQAV